MNRNDFLHMMEGSAAMSRQMIGEVYELINIFPYFQSAHMLLLKGLQNSADVKFEKQLHDSSVHIADREVLYYYLRNNPVEDQKEEDPVSETPVPDETADSLKTDEEFNNQQTVIEAAKNSEDLIIKIEEDEGIPPVTSEGDKMNSVLQGHSILIGSEANDEDPAGIIIITDDEQDTENEKIFYMDPGISTGETPDLLELDIDDKSPYREEKQSENFIDKESGKAEKRLIQSELIDKFILENPRIEPDREKTDAPQENISSKFVEETGGFVTETLARIYINQGYYSKAIDIYEKLSLKFPEKSSYFASQIEMVKELIKK